MLLCNAIVGNYYDENKTVPEKLLMERRMIMSGNSDSNTIYILFRVITSDKDTTPRENQGLIISYQAISSKPEKGSNVSESNKKCHYLVPIYNDCNVFCYWISSRYLKVRKKDFCFAISDFVKEYWKQPTFTQEFTGDEGDYGGNNSNMVCFGSVSRDDYLGYNRVISIEKEENVQMVCVNLKYRNRDFIIIENLIESAKALSAPCSIFDGNDTIKEFYMNEEQDEEMEGLEELGEQVEKLEPLEVEKLEPGEPEEMSKMEKLEPERLLEQDQVKLMIEYGNKQVEEMIGPVSRSGNLEENFVDSNGSAKGRREDLYRDGSCNPGCCVSARLNDSEDGSKLFTVCAETNVSITQSTSLRLSERSNPLGVNREEVVITQQVPLEQSIGNSSSSLSMDGCQMVTSSSPLTLETCITASTPPVARDFSAGEKTYYNESADFQDPRSKTDLIQRNGLYRSGNPNSFNTCRTRNYANSFLPPGMQIGSCVGGNIVDQVNKEELILSRIESARRSVGFNYRVHMTGGGHHFLGGCVQGVGCNRGGGMLTNAGGNCGTGWSHHVGVDNGYNIELLSKRFNRVIGKADYLLEQLGSNSDIRFGKGGGRSVADGGQCCGNGSLIGSGKRGRVLTDCSSSFHSLNPHHEVYSGFYKKNSSSSISVRPKMVVLDDKVLSAGGRDRMVDGGQRHVSQSQSFLFGVLGGREVNREGETQRSFDYTRESNLSIVNGNDSGDVSAIVKKVFVDVQVDTTQLDDLSGGGVNDEQDESLGQGWCESSVEDDHHPDGAERTVDFDVDGLEVSDSCEGEEMMRRRSVIDPELVEIDFYVNGGKLKSSFSILNIILSRWSGMPIVSKL